MPSLRLILFFSSTALLLSMHATGSFAENKTKHDIVAAGNASSPGSMKILTGFGSGWTIRKGAGEASALLDGYYTIGTSRGLSKTPLDSATSITFGHPYARTSYPLLFVDGTWGKLSDFFVTSAGTATSVTDSLAFLYTLPAKLEARFVISMEDDGAKLTLSVIMRNLDSTSHTLGTGFTFDPALGNRGDGVAYLESTIMRHDTLLPGSTLPGKTLSIRERAGLIPGMRITLEFPDSRPATCILGNWNDLFGKDTPEFTPSVARTLYDLFLKIHWPSQAVPPGGSVSHAMVVRILQPDFGQGVFLRWDVADFLAMNDGLMFPSSLTSQVSLANLSLTSRGAATLTCKAPAPVTAGFESTSLSMGAQMFQYVPLTLSFGEIYEDRVVDLTLVYREGLNTRDSLIRPILIPATTVTDTGLTVKIDTVITTSFPRITAVMEASMLSTGQRLVNLKKENLFVFDNSVRIQEFEMAKDTSGGVTQADIVFVLDVTGSMGDEIEGVKNNILEFADSLKSRAVDVRLAMVTFLDVIGSVYPFTNDPAVFKGWVSAQTAYGGGDTPENSLDALYQASQLQFRGGASRIFIWITDAPYHEKNAITTRTKQDIVARMLELDITVDAIGDSQFQTSWYNPIVEPTGGQFFDIRRNFRDILLDIGRLQSLYKYRISYVAPQSPSGKRDMKIEVHYAGRGGNTASSYTAPGGASSTLLACYPNPFNPVLNIKVHREAGETGVVTIYNVLGQVLRTFRLDGPGWETELTWDAQTDQGISVASGIFFIRMSTFSPDGRMRSSALAKVLYLK
jgi:Mg-chelatase subunit ChlD